MPIHVWVSWKHSVWVGLRNDSQGLICGLKPIGNWFVPFEEDRAIFWKAFLYFVGFIYGFERDPHCRRCIWWMLHDLSINVSNQPGCWTFVIFAVCMLLGNTCLCPSQHMREASSFRIVFIRFFQHLSLLSILSILIMIFSWCFSKLLDHAHRTLWLLVRY